MSCILIILEPTGTHLMEMLIALLTYTHELFPSVPLSPLN